MKYLKNLWLLLAMTSTALMGQSLTVTLPNVQGNIGDTLSIPLTISEDISGLGIVAFQFQINFNAGYVEFDAIDKAGSLTKTSSNIVVHASPGSVRLNGISTNPLNGSGDLIYLKFILLKSGNINLTFKNDTIDNFFNEGQPSALLTNGRIHILQDPTIRVSPISGNMVVGETLKFSANGGTSPYTWRVSNPALASIGNDGLLTANARGTVSPIAKDAANYEGIANGISIHSFSVQIRDTAYYQNNYIEVPVLFKNYDQTAVLSGEFTLSYNKAILTFESLLSDASIIGSTGAMQAHAVPGEVSFSFAMNNAMQTSGELGRLRFKLANRSSGSTYIEMTNGMINENLNVKYSRGRVSITPLPNLEISPKTALFISGESAQFSVTGGFEPYTWTVSNMANSEIDASGLFTALAGGTTTIIVKDQLGAEAISSVIQIYDTWLAVRDSTANIHEWNGIFPLDVGSLPSKYAVVATSGKLSYNAKIDSIKVVTDNSIVNGWMAANKSFPGETRFALAGSDKLEERGGVLMNLHIYFNKSIKPGDRINIDLMDVYLNEGTPRSNALRGTITVGLVTNLKQVNSSTEIKVYPNPANDVLNINVSNRFVLDSYIIFDRHGRTVQDGSFNETKQVFIGKLPTGIYLLQIHSKTGSTQNIKIVKTP